MMMMRRISTLLVILVFAASCRCKAQEIKSAPGQFDYYVLNLSWAPEFCSTLRTLSPAEQAEKGSEECATPHTFVLHGLWPQNFDGTYPASCAERPGPVHPERNLDMTPSLPLLKHEWAKHGTCTALSPEAFFATARQAYSSVEFPPLFKRLDHEIMLRPEEILGMFYKANAAFPEGSFVLSCGRNTLTAIEACFSKEGKPIACHNLRSCRANVVKVTPENAGGVVE